MFSFNKMIKKGTEFSLDPSAYITSVVACRENRASVGLSRTDVRSVATELHAAQESGLSHLQS